MFLKKALLLTTCLGFATQSVYSSPDEFNVIYGRDNRYEANEYPDRYFREAAQSVAGMVETRSLRPDHAGDPENFSTFFKRTAARSYGVCSDELYAEQNVLPICSGFLVAPDLLVTAGHCVTPETPCEEFSWVFGFTEGTENFPNEDIYRCKKVLATELEETKYNLKDYAVIQLDRKFKNRKQLKIRRRGHPHFGEILVIIGHPFGIPLKIADGASVKTGSLIDQLKTPFQSAFQRRDYFIANLDSFVGNSGSPVFNLKEGGVEGILIEGGEDFTVDEAEGCQRARHQRNGGQYAEERVFRINKINYLKNL